MCTDWMHRFLAEPSMQPWLFCSDVLQWLFAASILCVQVMARTICMQFEGNWTPVTDIVVDKVGKYAYVIGSPHDAAATPVVMDVVLDVRTKVPPSSSSCSSYGGAASDSFAMCISVNAARVCCSSRRVC